MTDARDRRYVWHSPASLSPSEECAWAREVAAHAHAGQRDKAGEPFFRHCQRVADAVEGDKTKTVAFLHDILEKSPGWTSERLLECGFSPEVVAAVKILTRRPGETKDALTVRAAANPLSLEVKRADLRDNLAQLEGKGRSGAEYKRRLYLLEEAARAPLSGPNEFIARLSREGPSHSALPTLDADDARRAVLRHNASVFAKRFLLILLGLAIAGGGLFWILMP